MSILALDLGATALKSALFTEDGQVVRQGECPSRGRFGGEALLAAAFEVIEGYEGYRRIAVSTTGQVEPETGRIAFANENVPRYTGMRVREILEQRYSVPVRVLNDVNAAAMGEGFYGAAQGAEDFLCLTYGTGVGGAIVIGGRVYGGSRGLASEAGHLLTHPDGLPCACGQRGCYEQYASVTALLRGARRVAPDIEDGRALFKRLAGDPALKAVVDGWLREVGHGLVSLIHALNPSRVLVGGGVFDQPGLAAQLEAAVLPRLMESYRQVAIRPAALGNMAGLYGALRAALESAPGDPA